MIRPLGKFLFDIGFVKDKEAVAIWILTDKLGYLELGLGAEWAIISAMNKVGRVEETDWRSD